VPFREQVLLELEPDRDFVLECFLSIVDHDRAIGQNSLDLLHCDILRQIVVITCLIVDNVTLRVRVSISDRGCHSHRKQLMRVSCGYDMQLFVL
jgi:hypothetical protein